MTFRTRCGELRVSRATEGHVMDSSRGGDPTCWINGDRVEIRGCAVTLMEALTTFPESPPK